MTLSEIPSTGKREFTKEEIDGPKGPTGYPMGFKLNPDTILTPKKPKASKLTK